MNKTNHFLLSCLFSGVWLQWQEKQFIHYVRHIILFNKRNLLSGINTVPPFPQMRTIGDLSQYGWILLQTFKRNSWRKGEVNTCIQAISRDLVFSRKRHGDLERADRDVCGASSPGRSGGACRQVTRVQDRNDGVWLCFQDHCQVGETCPEVTRLPGRLCFIDIIFILCIYLYTLT